MYGQVVARLNSNQFDLISDLISDMMLLLPVQIELLSGDFLLPAIVFVLTRAKYANNTVTVVSQ